MRKKFVTVALLGTLIFTSTNFVGCTDYDDDINKLQEQVDALKSISISDLASQLQSLKDANSNLTTANAKMEAAIAEIKANIDALKEADKTLTSLVNGKVDQATYQAAINALNDKCSDLSSKVAALAALETAVNDLKANKADNSAVEELKKAVEKLQAVDSDFAARIGKLENTIENMNAVLAGKADQTTVDALAKSIEELKTSVAGVDAKIAKALEPLQASIAKLQEDLAKKADAATVAADIEKAKSELNGLITALKEQVAENLNYVKVEVVGRIAALESAKETMNGQIEGLKASIEGLKDRISTLEKQPVTDLTEVKAAIQANQDAIKAAGEAAGVMAGSIKAIEDRLDGLDEGVGTVKKYIDDAITGLNTTIINEIDTRISTAVAKLQSEYKAADADLQTQITALKDLKPVSQTKFDELVTKQGNLDTQINGENGLIKQLKDLDEKVDGLIAEALRATGPGSIDDAIAKKINAALTTGTTLKDAIEAAISTVTGRLDKVEADLNAVLERIQSIVFVPQYQDANGVTIVPAYTINNVNGTVEMTFRIAPADKVAELVKLAATNPSIFSFYREGALETRATSVNSLNIVADGITAGTNPGTIVIKAKVSDDLIDNTYPVALKLSNTKEYGTEETPNAKPVNDVTTDYFNLRVKSINNGNFDIDKNNLNILYTDVEEKATSIFKVRYVDGARPLTLAECGFTQNLEVYAVYSSAESRYVALASTNAADKAAIEAELTAQDFVVTKTAVKLKSVSIKNVDKVLKVQLADKVFGLSSLNIPNKTFEATYTVTKNLEGATISYGTIAKKDLQSGSSTAFTEKNGAFMWSGNASNEEQDFIIKAEKNKNFTDKMIAGATAEDILKEIADLGNDKIEHKVGTAAATSLQPTFNFNVVNDLITVKLPAGAERKSYSMSTIYHTDHYGDITLNATLNLSYPTKEELLNHQVVRWSDANTYFLEYDKPTEGTLYNINNELEIAYFYYSPDVQYVYSPIPTKDLNGDRNIDYRDIPAGVTVDADGHIVFTEYVDLSQFKVRLEAKIAGNVAATEDFSVKMYYPLSDQITAKNLTYKKADILLSKKLDVATDLNLSDRFNTPVIKKGKIESYGKTVYNMVTGTTPAKNGQVTFPETDRVRYIVKDGIVEGTTQTLSADEYFDITAGQFSLKKNINLTKNVIVTVQAAVDYTYGTQYSDAYTITIEATE